MYAEASLALCRDENDDFEEVSVLGPTNDKVAVAAVTARLLEIPDDYYRSVVTHGDKTSLLDGFIGTSFYTGEEMQSFLSKNLKRQYVFENCSFNPQQAVALLKSSTNAAITLSGCSFDDDCHSMSTYSKLLLNNHKDTSRSGILRFHAHGKVDPLFLKNLNFMENMLLNKLTLSQFDFNEAECRRVGQAHVTSLTLEHCTIKQDAELSLIRALRSDEMYASTLNVIGKENTSWWKEVLTAIGSPQCCLRTVSFLATKWSPDLCNILINSLRTNEKLTELTISAKPSDFEEQWCNFLDVIGSHKTLQKVTMFPQADRDAKWTAPINDLFGKSHRIVLFFQSNNHEKSQWAISWNSLCLNLRFCNIPRLMEDETRSFVLTSAMAAHSKNTDHLYLLLKTNQNFISMPR